MIDCRMIGFLLVGELGVGLVAPLRWPTRVSIAYLFTYHPKSSKQFNNMAVLKHSSQMSLAETVCADMRR